jgi:hypothetical protein
MLCMMSFRKLLDYPRHGSRRPRLDLPALHEYLGDRLAAPKWPQCLVFMDGLPESHQQAVAVKLGERLGLPELNDAMHPSMYLRGQCPPQGTLLETPFPVHQSLLRPVPWRNCW